ncbi:helix-turn-helix domain-containing protein [Corynebacterium alimapuense]|uniref:XRE family transcriptional regulator n=1 Tax=Corynebacterium alimapuense TaxID=1576874 RepID=A0A3M8KB85_9CORY|nr:XRE family transcriptional regulator [Corynebacterium alimapuense]RNE49804.1 XRE family transcriptional regulator [Corynebacterium alimapuense]
MDKGIDYTLSQVGPRLKSLRTASKKTLQELSEHTGISLSTLSRLESGRRHPTLEQLLPLARVHGVPLDELVGAPPTGDPRIHIKPIIHHGMMILPLSRDSGSGIQAFKHVMAAGKPSDTVDLQSHEGYEWLYVLKGKLRLCLGKYDIVMPAGEAAEFDTRTPHWFGRADEHGVEFLSLFGPQGERLHVRAKPIEENPA